MPGDFVLGQQSIDNAAVCQELVHSLRYSKAKKGVVVIKVKLEKSYDRLEWSFIASTLKDAGMPSKLIYVIMRLISSETCRLLWNGEITDVIKPIGG